MSTRRGPSTSCSSPPDSRHGQGRLQRAVLAAALPWLIAAAPPPEEGGEPPADEQPADVSSPQTAPDEAGQPTPAAASPAQTPPAGEQTPPAGEHREPPDGQTPPEGEQLQPPDEPIAPPELLPPTEAPDLAAAKRALGLAAGSDEPGAVAAALEGVSTDVLPQAARWGLAERDERVRAAAARLCGSLGKRAPTAELWGAVTDPAPAVAVEALGALASLGQKESRPLIEGQLGAASVLTRCAALDAYTRLASKKQLAAAVAARVAAEPTPRDLVCLVPAGARAGTNVALDAAFQALDDLDTHALLSPVIGSAGKPLAAAAARAMTNGRGARTAGLLRALESAPDGGSIAAGLLGSARGETRDALAQWLVLRADDKAVAKALAKTASTGEPALRAVVIDALASADARALARQARDWLSDRSSLVRAAAARVFARTADRRESSLLLAAYQTERGRASDENLDVRVALLEALGRTGSPDLAAVFVDALAQAGEEAAAVEALVSLGEPSVGTLALVVKLGDANRTPYALDALARIGAGVGDMAGKLLTHPRESVRKIGLDLLGASEDPNAVDVLVRLLGAEALEDPVPVIQALATFSTPGAVRALLDARTHPSAAVRRAALLGLGETQVDSREVLDALVQSIETDADQAVKVAGIQSLYRLGAPTLATFLSKLLQFEGPDVRMAALDILGWLRDPQSLVAIAQRYGDAVAAEKELMGTAIERITGRKDLNSARALRDVAAGAGRALGPEGERSTVNVGDVSLSVRAFGAGYTTLVLGGAHSGRLWAASLAQAGETRSVAVDGRGRGLSPAGSKPVSIAQDVADLEAVRAALGAGKVRLAAQGSGCFVALAYARQYPERVTGVLLVSPTPWGTRAGGANGAARRLGTRDALDLASLDARFAWYAPAAYLSLRFAALAPGYVGDPKDAIVLRMHPPAPAALQALQREAEGLDVVAMVKAVNAPVLVVYGEKGPFPLDAQVPLKRLAEARPSVRLTQMKGLGHYPMVEDPAAMAGVLRQFAALR